MTNNALASMKQLFAFPFQGQGWQNKFIIGSVLIIASHYIPLIPLIPVFGYFFEVTRRAVWGDSYNLPEWADWGSLFKNGLRWFGAAFIFSLPGLFAFILGVGAYFISVFVLIMTSEASSSASGPAFLFTMLAFAVMMLAFFIAILFSTIGWLFFPAALSHIAGQSSLKALFSWDWWRVFKANIGSYLLVFFVLNGFVWSIYLITYLVSLTIILCFLSTFIAAPLVFYMFLVVSEMAGQAYREGKAKLAASSLSDGPDDLAGQPA
jgi:hypothetical protein